MIRAVTGGSGRDSGMTDPGGWCRIPDHEGCRCCGSRVRRLPRSRSGQPCRCGDSRPRARWRSSGSPTPRWAGTPTTSASPTIGELSTRSEEFRVPWAAHDVKLHRAGTKRCHIQSSVTSHSASFVMAQNPCWMVPAEDDLCWGLAVLECQVNDRGVLGRAVRGVRVSGGCCVTSGRQQNVSGLFSWSLASTRSAAGVDRGRARAGLGRGGGSRRALVG
jgi:hypothetical protein